MAAYVGSSSIAGGGLFASQRVEAGGLVYSRERPTFAALDTQRLPEACSNCFAWKPTGPGQIEDASSGIGLKICTGCRTLRYCSKQCQAQAWPTHKKECKFLGQIASKGLLPNAARLVLQMLTSLIINKSPPLQGLESHLDKITKDGGPRAETLDLLSGGLHEYTGKICDIDFFRRCFALVYTNTLTVTSSTFDPLGICVDEFVSKANHSCDPNSFLVFDGTNISLRALRPISRDEEILITYIDVTSPYDRRQGELLEQYYFTCRCSKCAKGATLTADVFLNDEKPNATTKEVEALAFSKLDEAKDEHNPVDSLNRLNEGLQACLDTKIWLEHRQPIPSLRHEAFVTLLSAERWTDAFKQGLRIYFDINPELYPQPFHPLRVIQKWTLAKLALFMADKREAGLASKLEKEGFDFELIVLGLLMEVLDNVPQSHGPYHSFALEVQAKCEEVTVDMSGGRQEIKSMKDRLAAQWEKLRAFAASGENSFLVQ